MRVYSSEVVVDVLRRKRCESLLQKGYARIREGQFDTALEIATQLEEQRHTGSFEIAALAHAGKGELETAVTILQRGVEVAPDVWLNWQLLGNYLSDLERYDDADAAYQRALACPGCSQDSVRLNLAVLASRRHRPEIALELLDTLRDPALVEHAREFRVSTLQALGRLQEALALAETFLVGGPPENDEGAARWEPIAATAGRIRLALGHDLADVRRWVLDRLSEAPASAALFRVLRELDPQHSPAARRFEIFVHGAIPLRSPERGKFAGFFETYHVAAETPEHGLELIRKLEELMEPEHPANLSIDTAKDLGPAADEPLGVMWRSRRHLYERED
jgi:tetratricopeptide (TPR) repeat protein